MKSMQKLFSFSFRNNRGKRISFSIIILLLFFLNLSLSQKANISDNLGKGEFRASVVKIDITPDKSLNLLGYGPRKSTGVHDRIFHRIVALDDGTTQFFLVSTDICLVSPAEYDRIAARIKSELGISPMNMWWTATHTHSAPEVGLGKMDKMFTGGRYEHEDDPEYTAFVEQKLIEGIREARQKLSPARLGIGWGFSQANINRRAKDIDSVAFLGMDPDGPVDRKIGVLRIEKEDGTPLVLIANYPIHGTLLGGDLFRKISGDIPGVVSEYVEQQAGVPLLFINGAAGNLAPISGSLGQFRVLLGDKILEANRRISSTTNKVILCPGSLRVETPSRDGMIWPSEFGDNSSTTSTGVKMIQLPIRFLKINEDIAIWSAPVELFCEISNEVRERSPFPYTFYFGYTNGWMGYLVSEKEYKYKGYEPEVSPFTPAAAKDLTESVVSYLQGEMKTHKTDYKNTRNP